MELKTYQELTLATLRRFFEEARVRGPKAAYEQITNEPEQAKRLRGYGGQYRQLLDQPAMPYVCLRLPTGGGKTLLAAHAVAVARDAWIMRDFPLVLWLVPSNKIRQQTVEALSDPGHPYRLALAEKFGEPVRIFDIADFTRLRPHDLGRHLCVFVGTIQTLRVKDTEGRKVYAHHEALEGLFLGVDKRRPGLETLGPELAAKLGAHPDDIRFSFANLMHLHSPLMIVDEAHRAVTGLSREMQARVNPAAIVEFTATPHPHSNILHAVGAAELKEAEMIKLPVRLAEHQTWEQAVTGAIFQRGELAAEAARDVSGYIRPIVLFQAEDKGQAVTWQVLLEHLQEAHNIPRNKIAVATGGERGLDGVDLFDANCPVEYIITVEALKEGWDCSFAYVFCSVANIRSSTDAEQLLGRVLRMPYASRRSSPMLNKAYAHLVSKSFAEAANALRDRLVEMGFDNQEAEAAIESNPTLHDGLWGPQRRQPPARKVTLDAEPAALAAIAAIAPGQVTVETDQAGRGALRVSGFLGEAAKGKIAEALSPAAAAVFREEMAAYEAEHARSASPAELGREFIVPRLMARVQGELVFADTELLSEYFDWSLLDASPQLSPAEFSVHESADAFEIDLAGGRLTLSHTDQSDQLMLDIPVQGWTETHLVTLLAPQLRADDVRPADLLKWLTDVVRFLTVDRRIPLATLMRCRFVLARKLRDRIGTIRQAARNDAYQRSLFAPEAHAEVSLENGFRFFEGMFDGVPSYRGHYQFKCHFLPQVPAFDGNADGEEFKAAQQIDSLSEVEFWVRNVSGHSNAFKLPVAGGGNNWTYPDFVARLKDGRTLVVEYKGDVFVAASAEKRLIGELWARASRGQGIYVLAEKERDGLDVRGQIRAALSA